MPHDMILTALRAVRAKEPDEWAAVLAPALEAAGINQPRRVACFIGQCAHESMRFARLAEDTTYRSAAKLVDLFPSRVHSLAQAQALVAAGAEAIANCVYANRQGNGDEASGDGWRYRGAGLLQLTGRSEIGPFAKDAQRSIDAAADWLRTKEGATAGAVWYWTKHGLNEVADRLDHPAITRTINGVAMVGHAERVALSEAALAAILAAASWRQQG